MEKKITLISNYCKAAVHNATIEQKQEMLKILSYHVLGYEKTTRFKTGSWDGTSSFFEWGNSSFPAGFLFFAAANVKIFFIRTKSLLLLFVPLAFLAEMLVCHWGR